MKLATTLLVVSFGVILAPGAAPAAGRDAVTIEAKLSGPASEAASGLARLTVDEGRMVFFVKVRGLDPGACRLLVGGALQGFVFVEGSRTGSVRFDSRAFEEDSGVEEPEAMGLSFDPRGSRIQVACDDQVMLEAQFPARPGAGRR